ncbi:IS3 family transposase [Bathymodiolus platifrons methanotrophic gill symbiont]|uniref:IS3 family transposase n=1 Tax=Bathymodiolus platifrons methanotrophic gill symbiont TaxID=113268 RepID=UPI001C8D98AE|nr:IS3 family transposase [Bathymodiolus platifrons methanotrophic gill symbiont]
MGNFSGSIRALIEDVDDYIEFYNHQRFHETLDYKKPMNVYRESILANEQQNEAA